jgi:hypothetical protein
MPLALDAIEMALPVPFLDVRLGPMGYAHTQAENSRDADHSPPFGGSVDATQDFSSL